MTPHLAPGFENKIALKPPPEFLPFEYYSPGRGVYDLPTRVKFDGDSSFSACKGVASCLLSRTVKFAGPPARRSRRLFCRLFCSPRGVKWNIYERRFVSCFRILGTGKGHQPRYPRGGSPRSLVVRGQKGNRASPRAAVRNRPKKRRYPGVCQTPRLRQSTVQTRSDHRLRRAADQG